MGEREGVPAVVKSDFITLESLNSEIQVTEISLK